MIAVREETINNLGFWTAQEQQLIDNTCVAVAGLGGAGGMVVQLLGRCGVGQWRLADPDTSEVANIGRQAGASYDTVGRSKVDIATDMLRQVHRNVQVRSFHDGVSPANIDDFLDGADLVLEAIAFEAAWLSVLVGRRARAKGLPMVTSIEIGDGCQYTAFRPNPSSYEETVEAYFGVDPNQPATADMKIDVAAMLTFLPPSFPRGLLAAVSEGRMRTPAHSMGVARNASAVGRAMRELILHPSKDHDFYYPTIVVDDPDPSVGTFRVHHQERAELLASSLDLVEQKSGPRQFSLPNEYVVV